MDQATNCLKCGSLLNNEQIDGLARLVCTSATCDYIHWNNPVPVVAGLVEYENRIILIQNVGWPEEWYGLVTGYLEKSEDPKLGVVREIKEELNLDAEVQSLIGNYIFEQKNEIILAYHLLAEGTIQMNHELQDYKLVEKEKLQPWPFATGLAVKDWLKNQESL